MWGVLPHMNKAQCEKPAGKHVKKVANENAVFRNVSKLTQREWINS